MIISRLTGGLGNQLFQYCLGLHLSVKNSVELKVDINRYKLSNEIRQYSLDLLFSDIAVASDEDIDSIYKRKKFFDFTKKYYHRKIVNERSFNFDPNILKIKDNAYLIGFWQSEKYILPIKEYIRFKIKYIADHNLLQFNYYSDRIHESNSVCIFVRRGELVNDPIYNAHHGYCKLDYFNNAIELMNQKIQDPEYFIFSDDIEWCRENFITLDNHIIVEHDVAGTKYIQYFMLMLSCKNFIISNSTYSWWAAWLSNYKDKIVISPKRWFNQAQHSTSDLIPEEWVLL